MRPIDIKKFMNPFLGERSGPCCEVTRLNYRFPNQCLDFSRFCKEEWFHFHFISYTTLDKAKLFHVKRLLSSAKNLVVHGLGQGHKRTLTTQPCGAKYNASSSYLTTLMTSSNGKISALLALCAGNSPVTGEFPSQRPVSFDVFFDLRLNKRLTKQSWRRWFETPSCSLWRHCEDWISIQSWNSNI